MVFVRGGNDRSTFAVISLWGKFGGLQACGATWPYIVPLSNIFITRLFSKPRLKRKDFQEILRLPWAQEVSGSNPDARPLHRPRITEFSIHSCWCYLRGSLNLGSRHRRVAMSPQMPR